MNIKNLFFFFLIVSIDSACLTLPFSLTPLYGHLSGILTPERDTLERTEVSEEYLNYVMCAYGLKKIDDLEILEIIEDVYTKVGYGPLSRVYCYIGPYYAALGPVVFLDEKDIDLFLKVARNPHINNLRALQNRYNTLKNKIAFCLAHEIRHAQNQDSYYLSLIRNCSWLAIVSTSLASYITREKKIGKYAGGVRLSVFYSMLFLFNRYFATYREYCADIEAGQALGVEGCYAGAGYFQQRNQQEKEIFLAYLQQKKNQSPVQSACDGKNLLKNVFPFLQHASTFFDQDRLYSLLFESTFFYAVRAIHPSYRDRVAYLQQCARNLETETNS